MIAGPAAGKRVRRRSLGAPSRVIIRAPTPDDRDAFVAMTRQSRRLHRPWVFPPMDAESYAKYLARCDGERFAGFLICLREGGDLVGVVNVAEIIRGRLQSAFLGYQASAAHAGKGLMTEGLRLVVAHVFTKLKLHRIEANIQPANLASKALARRCGFRKEGFSPRYLKLGGRWRDHERWALTIEDWRRLRATPRMSGSGASKPRKSLN